MTIEITKGCYTYLQGLSTEDKLRVLKVYKDAGYMYVDLYDNDDDFTSELFGCHYLAVINEPSENNRLRLALLTQEELDSEKFFLGFSAKRIPAKDILESIMKERKKRVYAEAPCNGIFGIKKGDRYEVMEEFTNCGKAAFYRKHNETDLLFHYWESSKDLYGNNWKRIEIYEDEASEESVIPLTKRGDSLGVNIQTESQCLFSRIKQAKIKFDEAEYVRKELLKLLKEADEALEGTGLQLDIR